mmetsp:Transcript_19286/g.65167  ORF Transcript_19286/g.65167 Transcript_19286/m.65167 type:complete len:261 (+) Transcript_19286:235-1017(+)
MADVRVNMFSAAFDILYEYQPPRLLSEMEPTRAERCATTAPGRSDPARKAPCSAAVACTAAPQLTAKFVASHVGSTSPSLRSGMLPSACSTPTQLTSVSARGTRAASAAIEDASVTSSWNTCSRACGARAAVAGDRQHATTVPAVRSRSCLANSAPIPRDAPRTTKTASGSALRRAASAKMGVFRSMAEYEDATPEMVPSARHCTPCRGAARSAVSAVTANRMTPTTSQAPPVFDARYRARGRTELELELDRRRLRVGSS